jgi:hypothetical protein
MKQILTGIICILLSMGVVVGAEPASVGDQFMVGDMITIHGSTNYNSENNILVEVYPASFGPTKKYEPTMTGGGASVVPVISSEQGKNNWSANMTTANWTPDEYIVRIEVIGKNFQENGRFMLTAHNSSIRQPANQSFTLDEQ